MFAATVNEDNITSLPPAVPARMTDQQLYCHFRAKRHSLSPAELLAMGVSQSLVDSHFSKVEGPPPKKICKQRQWGDLGSCRRF